jgi:hypothetical protein
MYISVFQLDVFQYICRQNSDALHVYSFPIAWSDYRCSSRMYQSPSCEASSRSAALWNQEVYFRLHMSAPLHLKHNQLSPMYIYTHNSNPDKNYVNVQI